MKKTLILLTALFAARQSFALEYRSSREARDAYSCPKVYIGVSTGLENPAGLLGFNFDVPLTGQFSLNAGGGLSSWGYKMYGEGRFYFGGCNRGWALGAGISHNTGLTGFTTKIATANGDQDVLLDLKPLTNVFFSGYRFWNLGRGGNRFYLQAGYSVRLSDDIYTNRSIYTVTNDGNAVLKVLAPGGLMCAVGFSFGLGK